jgi:hypothetical protein
MSVEAFTMEIAGATICVQPLFQSTKEYCRPYLADREPEYYVEIKPKDLIYEQTRLEREAVEEGLKIRKFKEPFLERSIIQRRIADFLLSKDTIVMHGSTVAVDGRAYLFTAPCGTGKSTHTRLWREVFGDRAIMVNDDKPFLRVTADGVMAYGSPWSGKHGLATNICVPLKGICLLQRGSENIICRSDFGSLKDILYHQVHAPDDTVLADKAFSLVNHLAELVALWEMQCNKDLKAAEVAYCAMSANCE